MILLSAISPPTTETVGYFDSTPLDLAKWLASELGEFWNVEVTEAAIALSDLVKDLRPSSRLSQYWLFRVGHWTAVLNDAPRGTDLGVLPSLAARRLDCRAIRAVAADQDDGQYPAVILEVYGPEASDHPLRCRRTLFAANDGGTWRFGESGERFEFEEPERYKARRIRDRFTPDMLERYLLALGVPVTEVPKDVTPVIVRNAYP